MTIAGEIADELCYKNKWPWCCLGEAKTIHHFSGGDPAILRRHVLTHIGEHGIGAAKRHDRQLGEEVADLREHVTFAEHGSDGEQRQDPDRQPQRDGPKRPRQRHACRCICSRDRDRACAGALANGQHITDHRGRQNDHRKRRIEKEDGDKRESGQHPMFRSLERTFGDAQQRLDDNDKHGSLDAEKQSFDGGHLTISGVDHRQGQHDQRAGQYEQQSCCQSAAQSMQPPTCVGGELHGFRSRHQHAETERIEEAAVIDPFALIDKHAVHQRDLSGRPAERQQADAQPNGERFAVCGFGHQSRGVFLSCVQHAHAPLLVEGQLCASPVASRHQR